MQVSILGPLEVTDGGRPVPIAGGRLRALLTRLALEAGRPVRSPVLVEAVWDGEEAPADEVNALQTLVSRLRRALGGPDRVIGTPAGYRLPVAVGDVDVQRFERLAESGNANLRAGRVEIAAAELESALLLWRGPALPDLGAVGEPFRARLDRLRDAAELDRIEAVLALGRADQVSRAVTALDGLVAERPLDERVTTLLMRALAAGGRQAEALRAYERLRSRLADELGADPGPELQALQLSLLRAVPAANTAPPESGRQRRSNLRAQLTSFVGRDAEVARIEKALDEARLVTLVGPGGAGKTRLASEAVARMVDAVPDGVWFVELATVTDGADLPQTVLAALGLQEVHLLERRVNAATRDVLSRLLEGLADQDVVVVLDNCEHLIEAASRLADTLLSHCPRLRVLATSREPLGIFGETLVVVPPLTLPDPDVGPAQALDYPAVRLFADRAGAVRSGFAVDETTAGTVVGIVRRLDGLPLAIELAAARLRTMPLDEVAIRLSDRFRLLTGGSRTALPRHRTLRAVVEWSWELLTTPERRLVERLAVFPSGATTESATAICADGQMVVDDQVFDLIGSLVDKSLLQPVRDGVRVRMLETIREYGLERVAERGELRSLRRAHADYFADFMRRADRHIRTADQLRWLQLVADDRDNILAALRFRCDDGDADGAVRLAVDLSTLAMMLGNHVDVATWMAEALAVPGRTDEALGIIGEAVYAANAIANEASSGGTDPQLRRLGEIVDRLHRVPASAHPLVGLLKPVLALFAERPDLIDGYATDALAGDDEWTTAAVLMLRANVAENEGDLARMREDSAAALARFRKIGERWGTASALRGLAMIFTLDGDLDAAQTAYEEALRLTAEMGSRDDEAFVITRLADLAVRRGDFATARDLLHQATAASERNGSVLGMQFARAMVGEIERRVGDLPAARRLVDEALLRMESIPDVHPIQGHSRALVLSLAARLSADEGDLGTAAKQATGAYQAAVGTYDLPILAIVGVAVADLHHRRGASPAAAQVLGACARLRGSEDPTADDVIRLTRELRAELGDEEFASCYALGRALDREAAIARLDPDRVQPDRVQPDRVER